MVSRRRRQRTSERRSDSYVLSSGGVIGVRELEECSRLDIAPRLSASQENKHDRKYDRICLFFSVVRIGKILKHDRKYDRVCLFFSVVRIGKISTTEIRQGLPNLDTDNAGCCDSFFLFNNTRIKPMAAHFLTVSPPLSAQWRHVASFPCPPPWPVPRR
jgi:hypothetical protein